MFGAYEVLREIVGLRGWSKIEQGQVNGSYAFQKLPKPIIHQQIPNLGDYVR